MEMMVMERRMNKHIWLCALLMLLCGGLGSSVCATPVRTSTNSRYQPFHHKVVAPIYQFQSTSTCHSLVGYSMVGHSMFDATTYNTPYCAAPGGSKPRRTDSWEPGSSNDGDSWDDPDDNPTGVIPDPAPVGEPLILLLFALLFIGYKRRIAG